VVPQVETITDDDIQDALNDMAIERIKSVRATMKVASNPNSPTHAGHHDIEAMVRTPRGLMVVVMMMRLWPTSTEVHHEPT
jgi:hypothetical protein